MRFKLEEINGCGHFHFLESFENNRFQNKAVGIMHVSDCKSKSLNEPHTNSYDHHKSGDSEEIHEQDHA